ncbi:L-lactate MFS transporter [Vallitalea sp.]|uniref:L-lactate MFS transporter n=1 Tax=Vallitalea sp. TaxID=1882829 RepID=UPI002600D49E|nr:OFA family MFS transporter [Vallitalea sp.]MCT4688779.1 OFA family MFS transporter [Vallitalea sp.]
MNSLKYSSTSSSTNHYMFKRWTFVILGMIMFMCLGTVYSWSVFRTPIEEQYQIDATLSGLPYLVFLLSYTASMVITGKLIDRLNPKIMILIGGVMVGIGWILSGIAVSFSMIILSYGAISGAGVGIAYGPPIKVISSCFTKKRGIAIGLLLAGFGLSPLITAPITKALINQLGVNNTFKVVGIFFLIVIPLLGLYFEKPAQVAESNNKLKIDNNITNEDSILELIKNTKFQGLWLCFVIGTSIGLMIIGISSQIGEELFKINSNTTASLLSIFAIFNAIGRPLFGWITDRFSPFVSAMTSFILIFITAGLMYMTNNYTILIYIIALSVLWMNLGAWLSIAPTTIAMYFGEANYSRNYGVLFTAYGIGAVIGTPLAGFIRTQFGSYHYIFLPIMIMAIIGMFIALLTIKPKKITKL